MSPWHNHNLVLIRQLYHTHKTDSLQRSTTQIATVRSFALASAKHDDQHSSTITITATRRQADDSDDNVLSARTMIPVHIDTQSFVHSPPDDTINKSTPKKSSSKMATSPSSPHSSTAAKSKNNSSNRTNKKPKTKGTSMNSKGMNQSMSSKGMHPKTNAPATLSIMDQKDEKTLNSGKDVMVGIEQQEHPEHEHGSSENLLTSSSPSAIKASSISKNTNQLGKAPIQPPTMVDPTSDLATSEPHTEQQKDESTTAGPADDVEDTIIRDHKDPPRVVPPVHGNTSNGSNSTTTKGGITHPAKSIASTSSSCSGHTLPQRLLCQVVTQPMLAMLFVTLTIALWLLRRRRYQQQQQDARGEYRAVAARFTGNAFDESFDDDLVNDEETIDNEIIDEGWIGNGQPAVEMSSLGKKVQNDRHLALEEING